MKNNKNSILFTLSAVLLIGAFFSINPKKNHPNSTLNNTNIPSDKIQNKQKGQLVKRVPLKSSRYEPKKKNSAQRSFPNECHNSLDELEKMTREEYSEIIKSRDSFDGFFTSQCLKKLSNSKVFAELSKNLKCDLLNPALLFKEKETLDSCISILFALKAYSISDHTKGIPVDKMTSEELAANFVKILFKMNQLDKETFKENLNLLDTFYDMHSDDNNVVEAYLAYLLLADNFVGEELTNSKFNFRLSNSTGSSFKIDRFSALKKLFKKGLDNTKSTLDNLNDHYNDEPELQYYYAVYYWKSGNKAMANKFLDKAISMGDKCSHCSPSLYKDAKKKLQNAKLGDKGIFSISIGLNFENL